jgi:5-hydroxyisourate hydrolase-like protein (transthyretin family)
MIVDVSPTTVEVLGAAPVVLVVTITNDQPVIAAYEISVLGVDPTWLQIDEVRPSLFPDSTSVVTITVNLPAGIPAGTRRLAVQIEELTPPALVEAHPVELVVPSSSTTRLELDPSSVTAGTTGTFGFIVRNEGNGTEQIELTAVDEERELLFAFVPGTLVVEPGERVVGSLEVKGKRPLTGSPKVRPFTVSAIGLNGEPVSSLGVLVQRPRLSRGALGLLGLLAAISVFAAVIATTFGRVVDRSTADRDLLLQAIQEADDEGAGGPVGGITGTALQLTTGDPIAGVTVDTYPADDLTATLATTVTSDDGTYAVEDLPEGDYKIRFRGAGFDEVWFPQGIDPENGEVVAVAGGETTGSIDVRLGGVPSSLAGTIRGEDPSGATVSVRLPAASALTTPQPRRAAQAPATQSGGATTDPLGLPVIASTVVDATGEFLLAGLPSPATYTVVVTKEGFAAEVQLVNLAAGEERTGLEIELRRGDGTISGRVNSSSGPLGGATVTASDGRTTVATATLTRDDIGAYSLRSLPTPGTFTIVVSSEGFITETLSVTLGLAEERSGVDVSLGDGAGSISGRTLLAGVGPTGGVRVRATNGEVSVETASVSVGDVGSYRLTGLPVPGTYTVTFDRPDLAPQTRSIAVDAFGAREVTGADVTLISATGSVFGTVRDADLVPTGNVQVTFSSSDRTFRTRTASTPAGDVGHYELRGLPPGTYAATFEREGSAPTGLLVIVSAGERRQLDATLIARSRIDGTVTLGGQPASNVRVILYFNDDFPDTALQTTFTDALGRYTFLDLDAPAAYVITYDAIPYDPPDASRNVIAQPGEDVVVPNVELAG